MINQIDQAVKILNEGGIIVFPTDTAFGIGCRIDNEKAIEKLFKIRKRPIGQAVPVLVSGIEMAKEYLLPIPSDVKNKLIKKYWPGALTIILPCKKDLVPELVRGGGETLGVRMPENSVALEIINKIGVPLLGSSANFSKDNTPFSFEELNTELLEFSDYVIYGKPQEHNVSTVIDCSKKPWEVLRKGPIKISNIKYQISKTKNIVLRIDTSKHDEIEIALIVNNVSKSIKGKFSKGSQVVLPFIAQLLKENKLDLKQIDKIEVSTGPGSYTGLRVGISVANALGFALKIPVNGEKAGKTIEPIYK